MKVPSIQSNVLLPKTRQNLRRSVAKFAERVRCHLDSNYALEVANKNMAKINVLYLKGNPDIASKVKAVNEYVMRPDFSAPKVSENRDLGSNYYDASYEELIGSCENVDEIYNEFGSYGLIAYAHNICDDAVREKLLPKAKNYKISEGMVFIDKPISLVFNQYLASNSKGYAEDLSQRFGQSGYDLFEKYRLINCVQDVVDDNWKSAYRTTSLFDEIIKDFIHIDEFNYAMKSGGLVKQVRPLL